MHDSCSKLLVSGCLALAVAATAAVSSPVVAWDGETYVLSVRGMEVLHEVNTDDRLSPAPEFVVRIVRTDPDVRAEIRRLEEANARREAQGKQAWGAYWHSLTQSRRESHYRVESMSDAQIRARVRRNEREAVRISREISATKREVANLQRSLFGSSAKVRASAPTVDFGDRAVIRVYPDDELEVSVWDDDPIDDDLYGRTTRTLDRAILEAGSLEVSMPNIRFVRLEFRRDEGGSPTE